MPRYVGIVAIPATDSCGWIEETTRFPYQYCCALGFANQFGNTKRVRFFLRKFIHEAAVHHSAAQQGKMP